MSEPTADEIARWAARHVDGDGECWTCEQPWPCEPSRLLVLVAAQAEQIAGLRASLGRMAQDATTQIQGTADDLTRAGEQAMLRFRDEMMQRVVEPLIAERDAARAELAALHATDDYQRWARAVVERDAAREELRAAGVRFEKALAEQDAQLQKALAERREALAERDAARKQVRRVRVVIDEMAAKREYSALLFAWANELREALDPEPPR